MDTRELKKLLCEALPAEKIDRLADELGIVTRQSKIRLVELVMALVLTARTSAGGRQADALRHYREATGQKQLARGAFYARFTGGLEKLLEELLSEAMYAAEAQPALLPPSIATVKDWLIVDSTTVKLNDELLLEYPGTGDYAQRIQGYSLKKMQPLRLNGGLEAFKARLQTSRAIVAP